MPEKLRRGIIKTSEFEKSLAGLFEKDIKRADEFISGCEWLLANDPHRGIFVCQDPPVWMIPHSSESIEVAVFYCFNDQRVWMLHIG